MIPPEKIPTSSAAAPQKSTERRGPNRRLESFCPRMSTVMIADMVRRVVSAEERKADSRATIMTALSHGGSACFTSMGRAVSAAMSGKRTRATMPENVIRKAMGMITAIEIRIPLRAERLFRELKMRESISGPTR